MPHVEPSIVECAGRRRLDAAALRDPRAAEGRVERIACTSPTAASFSGASSCQNRSVSFPCVVTTGTRANRPAITVVRRDVTPSGYGCSITSHAAICAARSAAFSGPVALTRSARLRSRATSADRNASLPEPMSRKCTDGCASATSSDRVVEQRRHQRAVRAEMSDQPAPSPGAYRVLTSSTATASAGGRLLGTGSH